MSTRILVVEDNADSSTLMEYLLASFGYAVCTAKTGEEGLVAALRQPPDAILCDLQLPDMDGFEMVRKLRAQPGFDRVPIVAVTAYAMAGDRDIALRRGFDGYLTKPIDPETFVTSLGDFLPRRPRVTPAARCKTSTVTSRSGSGATGESNL